ncbi:MAG: hypothetical protein A3K19_20370 [Lentisphaerae bacterium RIFOXYB12_FULL_65_16]|nr:MAG: hypothetical protein A3K19_20370 [Lentisphaerae bacterium RIFOXYB12_FULL_65_16]
MLCACLAGKGRTPDVATDPNRPPPPRTLNTEHRTPLNDSDWQALIERAQTEKVAALLCWRLQASPAWADIPEAARRRLQQAYYHTAAANVRIIEETRELRNLLAAQGVPVALLKGLHLASAVYANPTVRPIGDMDLLLRRADLATAREALLNAGYRIPVPHAWQQRRFERDHHHLAPMVRADSGIWVELHWHILPNGTPGRPDIEGIWARTEPLDPGDQVSATSGQNTARSYQGETGNDASRAREDAGAPKSDPVPDRGAPASSRALGAFSFMVPHDSKLAFSGRLCDGPNSRVSALLSSTAGGPPPAPRFGSGSAGLGGAMCQVSGRASELSRPNTEHRTPNTAFLVLCPEDLVLHLALHSACSDLFTGGLRQLCDLTEAVRRYSTRLDWDRLANLAATSQASRYVHCALSVARDLLAAEVPDAALQQLDPQAANRQIVPLVREFVLAGEWPAADAERRAGVWRPCEQVPTAGWWLPDRAAEFCTAGPRLWPAYVAYYGRLLSARMRGSQHSTAAAENEHEAAAARTMAKIGAWLKGDQR